MNDPKYGAQLPPGYDIDWSGEFAPDGRGQRPVDVDRADLDRADHGPALHRVQLDEGRAAGDGQRGRGDDGRHLALWLTGTPFSISAAVGFISVFGVAVQDGVLLISYFNQMRAAGLPVREAVMRGAELRVRPVVMTSLTAALGLFPAAIATSIGSQAQKPLAIVVVGGMLVHPVPDPLPDARALQLLPGPRRPRRVQERPDPGLALYRPIPSSRLITRAMPPTNTITATADDPSSTEPTWFRRVSVMKINWKLLVAVVVIAAGATGLALNSWTRGQVVEVLKQLSQVGLMARRAAPDKSWIAESAARSKVPWDRTAHTRRPPDRGDRPQDGRRQTADRADRLEALRHDRLRPGDGDRRPHPVR